MQNNRLWITMTFCIQEFKNLKRQGQNLALDATEPIKTLLISEFTTIITKFLILHLFKYAKAT